MSHPVINREAYGLIRVQIETKVQGHCQGYGYGLDDVEIVLGEYTDMVLCRERLFDIASGRAIPPIPTLHGTRLSGVSVVVDSATPHLWAVRPKLKWDNATSTHQKPKRRD